MIWPLDWFSLYVTMSVLSFRWPLCCFKLKDGWPCETLVNPCVNTGITVASVNTATNLLVSIVALLLLVSILPLISLVWILSLLFLLSILPLLLLVSIILASVSTRGLQRWLQTLVSKHFQALSVQNPPRRMSSILLPVVETHWWTKQRCTAWDWMDECSVSNYAFPKNCKMLTCLS